MTFCLLPKRLIPYNNESVLKGDSLTSEEQVLSLELTSLAMGHKTENDRAASLKSGAIHFMM